MTLSIVNIIAISNSAGTTRAGLNSFISLFEKRKDIRDKLHITDDDMSLMKETSILLQRIYKDVNACIQEVK